MKKVVIGMSGGVDSSVAAWLLKEQGYEVIGVTMQVWQDAAQYSDAAHDGEDIQAVIDAKRVAEQLGIPHYTLNFKKEFQESVVANFVSEYLCGRTPNPCNLCNRYVKWEALLNRARELGADRIATGHYARIVRLENGRYSLKKSVTAAKDQTYALCNLTQDQLAHTLMPLGEYTKEEVRAMAEKIGIDVANKPDSQEICFIPDHDYAAFIERETGGRVPPEGNFVNPQGEVLGRHKGIIHYTIGQRKGLGIAFGKPVFVSEIRPETNEVVLGENEDIFKTELFADNVNWMSVGDPADGLRLNAKIRYAHKGAPCIVYPEPEGKVRVVFEEPQRAITPGQSVVFYDGDLVAGGGVIL